MRTRKEVSSGLRVILPVIAAWLVDALAPYWVRLAWWQDSAFPTLPLVAVPGATDVTSSVPGLFMTVIAGGLSALCVEFSKVNLRGDHRPLASLVLVSYQFLLVVDVLRTQARDWWVWMLSWFGLVDLNGLDWQSPTLPVQSPWLALVCMVATILLLWRLEFRKDCPAGA